MPQPGEPARHQVAAEDSFFELLNETLANVEESARGQFLQRFFKTIAQVDLTEQQGLDFWQQIQARKQELSASLGRPVTTKTAIVDVLGASNFLHMPVLMEYDDLKKLQVSATTDPLTGLHNRRLFEEYFAKELTRAQRYGQQLALVLLDLHRFKEINDRYGHPQGDLVLQAVASTLHKTLRASDFAFRIGGDEFAVLLPQSDAEQASALSRRVAAQFEAEIKPFKLEMSTPLDFGVAVYPQDGDEKDALLRHADVRLYQKKHATQMPPRVVGLEPPPPRATTPAREGPPLHEIPPVHETPRPRDTAPAREVPLPPGPRATTPAAPSAGPSGFERRKWERVSLSGTRAYAVLGNGREKSSAVIDLSYGGVALSVDRPEELGSMFTAVLHVPILPPVRVSLRKVYAERVEGGPSRVGCSFVS